MLEEHGLSAELVDIDEVRNLGSYDAYVVGSGIYLGNWLKEARRFIDTHARELAERPTWLFASGSIVGEPPVADDPNARNISMNATAGCAFSEAACRCAVRDHGLASTRP